MRDDYLAARLQQIEARIEANKKSAKEGLDRRQEQKPLPEGMEERRKLQDRRKSRLNTTEKEKE